MKRFFILTLICTTALNACFTKEEVEQAGFYENWDPTNSELVVQQGQKTITIDLHHVPLYEELPLGTKICFPVPTRNYLENKNDFLFETNGELTEGVYQGPESGSLRLLWSLIKDRHNTLHTIPTARLWINIDNSTDAMDHLDLEELEEAGYKKNWLEKNLRSLVKKADCKKGENELKVLVNNKYVSVKAEVVPARTLLEIGTGVYFPTTLTCSQFAHSKSSAFFNYGRYCGFATPSPEQPFLSTIEDNNGTKHVVRTADLMIDSQLLDGIASPTPPSSPLFPYTRK